MDNKKFEQLIDLIINENEEQARALFHDIVVEKSREIYENIMSEEMDEDENMGGQVGQMMDEISAEHEGMVEAEDEEIDFDDDGDDEIIDIDADDESEHEEEELEDRVTDLEDKLDELMAEFEEIMGDHDSEESSDEEAGEEMSDEEMNEMEMDEMEMDEDPMMEAITLKKVAVTHGDNGVQNKSTVTSNSGQAGMDSKPVKFSGSAEANPTSPKKPSNIYSKGETQVKDATNWKNAPAQNNADLESTPKPVTKDGATGTKSPVAESRRTSTKRRV